MHGWDHKVIRAGEEDSFARLRLIFARVGVAGCRYIVTQLDGYQSERCRKVRDKCMVIAVNPYPFRSPWQESTPLLSRAKPRDSIREDRHFGENEKPNYDPANLIQKLSRDYPPRRARASPPLHNRPALSQPRPVRLSLRTSLPPRDFWLQSMDALHPRSSAFLSQSPATYWCLSPRPRSQVHDRSNQAGLLQPGRSPYMPRSSRLRRGLSGWLRP